MRKHILVIDDEPEILSLMQGWLSLLGYQVSTASDGDEGFWKIRSEKPDVVILDGMLPGRSGYQILLDLEKQPERIRKIPVIFLSGRPSMECAAEKTFAFVAKPFFPKALLEVIEKAIASNPYYGLEAPFEEEAGQTGPLS
ncbi:MAG: response regulator [Candidatus Omnitrophota bacterium]